ncbi:MAG TPA: methyltransferase domain-containing protein [Acidimicrobiales bacterium]
MADERIRAEARGFHQGAEAYEVARPSYPADAVACIVGRAGIGPGRAVLDLAAGTGKLTRLLTATGADVIAVEPIEGMRTQLKTACPDVEVLDGTAESIPVAEASVDAVTVAQAFHWFDPQPALAEVARVLRPEGSFVLVWNVADRESPWLRDYFDIVTSHGGVLPYERFMADVDQPALVAEAGRGAFTPLEEWRTSWTHLMGPEMLVERAASISVVASLPEAERAEVLRRIAELVATHPDLAGRESFGFPYVTRVLWCQKR